MTKGFCPLLRAVEPTRLGILSLIQKHSRMTPGQLLQHVKVSKRVFEESTNKHILIIEKISQSALAQHLSVLKEIKLISSKREGTSLHYTINEDKMIELNNILKKTFANWD